MAWQFDYRVTAQTNWGIWGIKGKRYDLSEEAEKRVVFSSS
jgi:hypothetical protein